MVALNLENTETLDLFLTLSVYPGQPVETLKTSQPAIVAFWPERSEQKSGREELKKNSIMLFYQHHTKQQKGLYSLIEER